MDYKWVRMDELQEDIANNSENYTPWMRLIVEKNIFDK